MKEPSTTFVNNALDNVQSEKEAVNLIKGTIENLPQMDFKKFWNNYFASHEGISLAEVVKKADLNSKNYGYEIINGLKKGSRDKVIALCYAANMSVDDLDYALMYSNNSRLYVKNPRDAYIKYFFNNRIGEPIMNLNDFLEDNDCSPLDT